jgi:diguanylate cyclase (GGDEF)-like protein
MATIGLPKSASVIPVARHRARAPAIVRPWVEVFDRSSGMRLSLALPARTGDTGRLVSTLVARHGTPCGGNAQPSSRRVPLSGTVDAVPLTIALPVAALAGIAVAAVGVGLLGAAPGRRRPPLREAYCRMLFGVSLGAMGLAGSALLLILGGADLPARLLPFAAAQVVGVVLLLAGLLRLPGVADRSGDAARHVLDGALIAACTVHIGWTLVVQPRLSPPGGHAVPDLAGPDNLLVAVPALVTLAACGVAGMVAVRARRPRTGQVLSSVGVAATALTGYGLLLVLRHPAGGTAVAALGIGYALALGLTALAVRRTDRLVAPELGLPGTGTVLALVPAGAAISAGVARIVIYHSTDNLSILSACVVGALITGRQILATRAAHQYANKLAEREATFREMAYTDALTGLGNRRQLNRVLYEDAVGGPPCVLLAIDMDGFKNVNDIRGHDIGDAVLVEVARRLRANLRPGDVAARLGGDEFAVLMWSGPDEAYRAAQRLLTVLGGAYDVGGSAFFLSASIGLAGCRTAENVPQLLHNADLALRFAKQRGKSRVERYDASYDQWMRRRTTVEQELRTAIEREQLTLVYQPVVELPAGRPVGVETLLRWSHPTLGQVSPGEFIPVAEEAGIIDRLDRWVLHQACHQLSRWMADGHRPWISVNISVRDLHLPDYVAQVVEVLRAHRVPPEHLVLEVTEHAVALDPDEVIDRLVALRSVGVRIALDDFGAGYSSLGQLRDLPIDILKIDRMLVVDSEDEPARDRGRPAAPLVGVVMELGRKLDLEVIAEGVSLPSHRDVVAAAGCRLIQGELYGNPLPAERVEALLAQPLVVPAQPTVHHMGQVDAGHEMRQS